MKTRKFQIRVNLKDYEKFKNVCENLNVTMSAFIRSIIKDVIGKDPQKEFQLKEELCDEFRFRDALNKHALYGYLKQIRYLGNNINQISRSLNVIKKSPNLSQFQIKDINTTCESLREVLNKLLSSNLSAEVAIKSIIKEENV